MIKSRPLHNKSPNTFHRSGEKKIRINHDIQAEQVRLIDQNGNQQGIVSLSNALEYVEKLTRETSTRLDLVEIAPSATPPVCQVQDYSKYIFELKKKKALQQKKQKRVKVKEIKLRPSTENNDYEVKLRHLIDFLKAKDRVKITIRFKGREIEHKEIGTALLARLRKDVEAYGVIELAPKAEGRQLTMVIVPKK